MPISFARGSSRLKANAHSVDARYQNRRKRGFGIDEKREANDHVALREAGKRRYKDGDYKSAFEYLSKAAELGDVEAHYQLSFMYRAGEGEKDEKKKLHHLEVAAIGGHPDARFDIGFIEYENGKPERSVKHWTIAAKLGHDHSLQSLSECYKGGLVSTEDFAAALRGHQAAVDATKSTQREAAEAALLNEFELV